MFVLVRLRRTKFERKTLQNMCLNLSKLSHGSMNACVYNTYVIHILVYLLGLFLCSSKKTLTYKVVLILFGDKSIKYFLRIFKTKNWCKYLIGFSTICFIENVMFRIWIYISVSWEYQVSHLLTYFWDYISRVFLQRQIWIVNYYVKS